MNSEYLISFLALSETERQLKTQFKREAWLSHYSNNINYFNSTNSQKTFTQTFCANVQEQIAAEEEGEEQFVLLKERATHVAVQVVGKGVNQVS